MDCNEPLRIRAYLRSPVISDEYLPLDGLLLYEKTRQDLGAQSISISGASLLAQPKGENLKGGRLPLKIIHAKDWYYSCSWAEWGSCQEGKDYWSKRFDSTHAQLIDFGQRRGKVDISAGAYKAYRMPVYYRSAIWVQWYCMGNQEQLEPLLRMVTHLGKKATQGWGRVASWEITPIEEDYSIWQNGKLMRGIPEYHYNSPYPKYKGLYGIRPSYWDRRNQLQLCLPTGRDEQK